MLQKKLFGGLVVALFFVCTTPVWAFMRLDLDGLKVDEEVIGKAVSETEMDGIRGAHLINDLASLVKNLYALKGTTSTEITPSGTTITKLGNNNNHTTMLTRPPLPHRTLK
jgi:hypothetical protein